MANFSEFRSVAVKGEMHSFRSSISRSVLGLNSVFVSVVSSPLY
jgi:hypothetical protein